MPVLSLVRIAEAWTVGGVVAFLALVAAVGIGIAAIVGRLSD
jgi:hypothetical protein